MESLFGCRGRWTWLTSGAIYSRLPTGVCNRGVVVNVDSLELKSKSPNLIGLAASLSTHNTFSGFTSRCATPWSWRKHKALAKKYSSVSGYVGLWISDLSRMNLKFFFGNFIRSQKTKTAIRITWIRSNFPISPKFAWLLKTFSVQILKPCTYIFTI